MVGGEPSAYDQGAEQGRINAVLSQHGEHLAKINGSQATTVTELANIKDLLATMAKEMASELAEMSKEMAAIRQQAKADADTRIALAAALERDAAARREKDKDTADALKLKSDETWQPYARALVVVAALVGIIGLVATLLK